MSLQQLTWLLLPMGYALACGGRYERTVEDSGNDVAGSSATGASAGSPNSAGTSNAGGPMMGGDCACDPIACGPGYKTVPKGCCWECVIDVAACERQRQQYVDFRAETISNQSMNGCMIDADCGLFEDRTGCSPTCPFVIPNSARRGIDDRLYNFAQMTCNRDCPAPSVPPCVPPSAPVCEAGRCL
jgi:hypothetical protein